VEEAELMAGAEISAVFAGIAGGHIRGSTRSGRGGGEGKKEVKQGRPGIASWTPPAPSTSPQDREIPARLPQE